MKLGWRAALAAAAVAISLPAAGADEALRKAVDAGNARFLATRIAGDAAGFAALFDEDGALLETGGTVVRGRAVVRQEIAESMGRGKVTDGKITTTDLFEMGDVAYETGRYSFTIVAGEKPPVVLSGRYVEVWKKQSDGGWKMFRDIGLPD